jgi:hypothetical protein
LLEDLYVVASHEPFGSDVFLPWLGPRSRADPSRVDRASHPGRRDPSRTTAHLAHQRTARRPAIQLSATRGGQAHRSRSSFGQTGVRPVEPVGVGTT